MKVACIWFQRATSLQSVAEHFLRFSPQIALRGDRAIFVEIGKCRRLYSEESFVARSNVILRKLSLAANISIGKDITDSLCKAKFGIDDDSKLPLGALLDFIDPFQRDEVLRKSVLKMIDSFSDLGIRTIGDFKKIPVGSLIERFGVIGRFAHQRVRIEDYVGWPAWAPEEVIFEKSDFAQFEFYGELEPMLFELKGQLDRIFSRLYARQRKAMALQIEIKCEKFSTVANPVRILNYPFFAPQGGTKGTLKVLKERLAREFEKNPVVSPIQSVKTTVTKAVPANYGQRNLLDDQEEKSESIFSIHNQLVELLGPENVFQAELTDDRRPERSWRKATGTPHDSQENEPDVINLIPERATYLFRTPIKIDVTAGYVHIRKKRYKILLWDNNLEKICGGWEEIPGTTLKNTFDRNYYHVTIEGYQKLFVFETPLREYFLHGYYG